MNGSSDAVRVGRLDISAALASTTLILLVCLFPVGGQTPNTPRLCVLCGAAGGADFLANVLLFVPFGLTLRRLIHSLPGVVLLGLALSVSIEVVQIWIPGREPTLGDVIANGLGGAAGGLVGAAPMACLVPSSVGARRLRSTWTVFVLAVLGLVGFAAVPTIPSAPLYGNWDPDADTQGSNTGRVLAVTLGELPIPSRRLENQDSVRSLLRDGAPLRVRFTTSDPTPERTRLFRLLDRRGSEFLALSIDRGRPRVHLRTRADALRLSNPDFVLPPEPELVSSGDTVVATLRVGTAATAALDTAAGNGRTLELARRLRDGWTLLGGHLVGPRRWLGYAWLFLLGFPIGWWSSRPRHAIVPAVSICAALGMLPLATPLLHSEWRDYFAVLLAEVSGYLFTRFVSTRRSSTHA